MMVLVLIQRLAFSSWTARLMFFKIYYILIVILQISKVLLFSQLMLYFVMTIV